MSKKKKDVDISFFLDCMEWSYSRVKSFQQCPLSFYLTYIMENERISNAFAQWGTLVHSILERYFKGEKELWDLSGLYKTEYDNVVTERFPFRSMQDSYYNRGIEYFDNFDGKIGDEKKIISVEERYSSNLGGRPVVGVIDLVAENDIGLVVCDHKSRGKWKSKKERREYMKQLNFYAMHVKEKYGEYPKELWFNKFRENTLDKEPFNEQEAQKDVDWFLKSIDEIYEAKEFPAKPDRFFCHNLCSMRGYCEHSLE